MRGMTEQKMAPCPVEITDAMFDAAYAAVDYSIEPGVLREGLEAAWNKRLPPEGGEAKPVAWRWRPKGSTLWIYDPEEEWLNSQGCEIDREPLYTHSARAILSSEDGAYDRGVNDMREACAKIAREMKSGPIYYVDGKPNSRAVMGGDLIADEILRALPSPATISTGSAKCT